MEIAIETGGRHQQQLLRRSLVCGAGATALVLLAWWLGALDGLEKWLYDFRIANCQHYNSPPSDRLVHLDIDDSALDTIGHWPWPRSTMARLLREINLAKPKAVAIDVLYSESQLPSYLKQPDGSFAMRDDDAELAAALREMGNVIMPMSFVLRPPPQSAKTENRVENELYVDLEMPFDRLASRLIPDPKQRAKSGHDLEAPFLIGRRAAMLRRIDDELVKLQLTPEQLMPILLPHTDPNIGSPLQRLLLEQYDRAVALGLTRKLALKLPPDMPRPLGAEINIVPIAGFTPHLSALGFADYQIFFRDPVVRSVPLMLEHNGNVYPQLGLILACKILNADLSALHMEGSRLVIPAGDRKIEIPTWSLYSNTQAREISYVADIPWFGNRYWETMYDFPRHRDTKQHISINRVWEVCLTTDKIVRNNAAIDRAVSVLLDDDREDKLQLDPARAKKYKNSKSAPDDTSARRAIAATALGILKDSGLAEAFAGIADKDLQPYEKIQRDQIDGAKKAIEQSLKENDRLEAQFASLRGELKSTLGDRGVLLGWAATGAADVVPTSLHTRCPGVVVHGVIANAILTGVWWTRASPWIVVLLTIVLGMGVSALEGRLTPTWSALATIGLTILFALVNGYLLFDRFNILLDAAPPLVAIGVVWTACTALRLFLEGMERIKLSQVKAAIDHEVSMAKSVQQALIPKEPPKIAGVICNGWTLAATTTGGDCYDLWVLPDGRLGILLGDASGHGLAPSLIVSQVRSLVRVISELESHPQAVLNRVNARIAQDVEMGRFCTCFLAYLSCDGVLHYASAGQGPVLWSPGAGEPIQQIESTSLPLGILEEWNADEPAPPLKLNEGGMLFIMSDGIFEASGLKDEQFGVERVIELTQSNLGQPPEHIIGAVRERVQAWQGPGDPDDDQTMVVVKRWRDSTN